MKAVSIFFIFLLLCAGAILSCHPAGISGKHKIDGRLAQQMEKENRADIPFIGECSRNIDDGLKSRMEQTGIIIESIIGDIFTARGTRESILKLARIPEVKKLQAPKKYHLLENK